MIFMICTRTHTHTRPALYRKCLTPTVEEGKGTEIETKEVMTSAGSVCEERRDGTQSTGVLEVLTDSLFV